MKGHKSCLGGGRGVETYTVFFKKQHVFFRFFFLEFWGFSFCFFAFVFLKIKKNLFFFILWQLLVNDCPALSNLLLAHYQRSQFMQVPGLTGKRSVTSGLSGQGPSS